MARPRALLIGFQPGFSAELAKAGIDVVCRIGGGKADPGIGFIDHRDFFRYGRFDPSAPRVDADTRARVHTEIYDAFCHCAGRYANTRAMLNEYSDGELLFDKALSQARSVVEEYRPDILIAVNAPHRCATLALFEYARASGVKTALCLQSQFPDRFFIVDHWTDLGIFKSAARGESVSLPHYPPQQMPFYMKRVDTGRQKSRRAYLKYMEFAGQLLAVPFTGLTKGGLRRSNRTLDGMREAIQLTRYARNRRAMPAISRSQSTGDFVYFPLHLQPEMTTAILGGKWTNQARALQRLREFVPDEIPVIVKENPKQTGLMRSPLFWELAGSLPNTFFVEDEASSLELIRVAKLTATVSGTAGWEALRGGRPALAFGHVFWRRLPGAFHIDESPQWNDIEAFDFDNKRFSNAVEELSRYTHSGVSDANYAAIVPGFDPAENAGKVAASIATHFASAK